MNANAIGAMSAVSIAIIHGLRASVPEPITWTSANRYTTIVNRCMKSQVLTPDPLADIEAASEDRGQPAGDDPESGEQRPVGQRERHRDAREPNQLDMAAITTGAGRDREHGRVAASTEQSPWRWRLGRQTDRRRRGNPGRVKPWDGHVEHVQALADSLGFREVHGQIIAEARLVRGDRVLDVGAGTGLLTLAAASRVSRVTALDNSRGMCRHLERDIEQRSINNVDVVAGTASDLPLADASFDVVLSNYCLHHLTDRDKRRALSEAIRVLRPNGRLVVGDMMFDVGFRQARDRAVILRFTREMLRRGPAGMMRSAKNAVRFAIGRGEHLASIDWWCRELDQAGFSEIAVRALHHGGGIATARRRGIRALTATLRRSARASPRHCASPDNQT